MWKVDAAAADQDPTKRIAYVAAFAMSNYSSTVGRIAKPFNPMLGETFEYVRLDKHYRYMSEQCAPLAFSGISKRTDAQRRHVDGALVLQGEPSSAHQCLHRPVARLALLWRS